jgi:ketosteroid isomerase-like protein
MSKDPRDVVVDFLTRGAEGKMEEAIALLADEVEFWYTGVNDVTRDDLIGGMRGMAPLIAPGGGIRVVDILTDGDRVAIEYVGNILLKTGKVYANTYHTKFIVKDGKITCMREYLDPNIVMNAFGALSTAQ